MSTSFPCRDFINALLESASKLMQQFLNICDSKVNEELRLEILHSLFKVVPICCFVKGDVTRGLFSLARYGIYKYPDYIMVTKTCSL